MTMAQGRAARMGDIEVVQRDVLRQFEQIWDGAGCPFLAHENLVQQGRESVR
jgi:hypothetical protein